MPKKSKVTAAQIRACLAKNGNHKGPAAASLKIGRSTLDAILARDRSAGKPSSGISPRTKPTVTKERPILAIEMKLPTGACSEIKLRNGVGLLGTLFVYENGVEYRKPNQKKGTGRRLSWSVLERLMQLGLV